MSNSIYNLIAEDKNLIVYRKSLRRVAGSVTATILLQQMMHRMKDRDRIYKFKDPCDHELYRPGDSWKEELGFSTREFDTALKKIGTKLTKGLKKDEVFQRLTPNTLVVYWTDRNRVTWYELNKPLLNAYLSVIYLNDNMSFSKITKEHLLKYMTKEHLHDLTESPTESPTEIFRSEKKPSESASFSSTDKQFVFDEELAKTFGDNPRQAEIDAWGDREPTTQDELLLIAMGAGVAPEIRAKVAQIRDAGWQVGDSEVETALAEFLAITGFVIPTTSATRKLFLVGIREHLEEEHFRGRLGDLYKTVWADIEDDVRDGLNITHPRAFTKGMYRVVNVEAGKDLRDPTAGLSRNDIIGVLINKGVIEWVETEPDKFAPCWAGTKDFVREIPEEIISEHF